MTDVNLIEQEGVFVPVGSPPKSEQDDPEMERTIKAALQVGWREAISGHELEEYVTNPQRTQVLLDIFELAPSFKALEIGPGLGQMSGEIAKRVSYLDAVEADALQARLCAIRASQDKLSNIRVIAAGQDARLPLPSGSYNFVLMNLVLEWCGIRSQLPHEECQRRYLTEIRRVLVPGGKAFISTKNRYAARLLVGGRDEHMAGMPFGNALPRPISALFLKGKRPRGLLHSRKHLMQMLMDSGFSEIEEYIATPDMRWPKAYVPAQSFSSVHAKEMIPGLPPRARGAFKFLPSSIMKVWSPGLSFLVS